MFPIYRKDVLFWPVGFNVNQHSWVKQAHASEKAERCYYYTCTQGDKGQIDEVRDALWESGFSSIVTHKPKNGTAKRVDISLTKDMLVHAFLGNYDIALLVAGDGDFIPVVEEVKRLGKRLVVALVAERSESRAKANGRRVLSNAAVFQVIPVNLDAAVPRVSLKIDGCGAHVSARHLSSKVCPSPAARPWSPESVFRNWLKNRCLLNDTVVLAPPDWASGIGPMCANSCANRSGRQPRTPELMSIVSRDRLRT